MKEIRSMRIELLKYKIKSNAKGIVSSLFLIIANFRQTITQYVINEFVSFLQRWIFFIESYNFVVFTFYYAIRLRYMLKNFNCTLFGS